MKWSSVILLPALFSACLMNGCTLAEESPEANSTPPKPPVELKIDQNLGPAESLWEAFLQAGLKVEEPLSFNYFFYATTREDAARVEKHFSGQGYEITVSDPVRNGAPYKVILNKVETMTKEKLIARYEEFTQIAKDLGIESFDGAEAGPP